jgi:hypothetical protein
MIAMKLIEGKKITDEDLAQELYEICEKEHSGCNDDCPIHAKVLSDKEKKDSSCPYFKNGVKMLEALYQLTRREKRYQTYLKRTAARSKK